MSRLRRPYLYDRFIFVTVTLLRSRTFLQEAEFARLATASARAREKHGFSLTAWVIMPDHWHVIIYPPYPLTISTIIKAVKAISTISINVSRHETGELWQGRFFDHALRTVRDYHAKVEYIHLNPVRSGLVTRAEDWKWSSRREFSGASPEEQERNCGLRIDRIPLPFDLNAKL
jgi:putative transposase